VLPSVASVSASPDAAQAALLGTRIGSPSDVILLRTGTGSKPGGAGDGVSGTAPHDVEGGGRSDVIPLVSEGVVRPGNNQAGFAITADGSPSDVTPLGSKTVASASSN
jgi:hypothetical protein